MGVAGLWDVLRPAAKTRSLTELSVTEGFEKNPTGVRGYRLGIDASIWFFHAEYGREGENPVLRTLFFRCATLMRSPFLPLFVFDGPKRPDIKRGKKINKTPNKLIPGMKQIVEAFGFEHRTAPGEAEAELAYLNRIGAIDGILSDDVDNFLFGAITVIRNSSNTLSGNRANPALNSTGKDDKNHSWVYKLDDVKSHPEVGLSREGLILVGLMSGGDYQQGGLERCGIKTAVALARCGFGDTLYKAATTLRRDQLPDFLDAWRHEMRHEVTTNSRGIIGRKSPALAKSITSAFPDIDILLSYVNPITSESMGRPYNPNDIRWNKEPDIAKLAETCEFYFEWGYKEAIIKRFRTVIWHSAVLRILRRAVLDLDEGNKAGLPPSTPRKHQSLREEACGTPSKMITKYFSTLDIGKHSDDSDAEEEEERLILKIHSTRAHASTDGLPEYRVEVAPGQLVRLAESGIKGLRQPEGPDEWASEEEETNEDGGTKKSKKDPVDPQSHMRLWMPACMVKLVEPRLVDDFNEEVEKRNAKKAGKGQGRRKKVAAEPSETPSPPKKKRTRKKVVNDDGDDAELLASLPMPKPKAPRGKKQTKASAVLEAVDTISQLSLLSDEDGPASPTRLSAVVEKPGYAVAGTSRATSPPLSLSSDSDDDDLPSPSRLFLAEKTGPLSSRSNLVLSSAASVSRPVEVTLNPVPSPSPKRRVGVKDLTKKKKQVSTSENPSVLDAVSLKSFFPVVISTKAAPTKGKSGTSSSLTAPPSAAPKSKPVVVSSARGPAPFPACLQGGDDDFFASPSRLRPSSAAPQLPSSKTRTHRERRSPSCSSSSDRSDGHSRMRKSPRKSSAQRTPAERRRTGTNDGERASGRMRAPSPTPLPGSSASSSPSASSRDLALPRKPVSKTNLLLGGRPVVNVRSLRVIEISSDDESEPEPEPEPVVVQGQGSSVRGFKELGSTVHGFKELGTRVEPVPVPVPVPPPRPVVPLSKPKSPSTSTTSSSRSGADHPLQIARERAKMKKRRGSADKQPSRAPTTTVIEVIDLT